ncbi:MAG: ATP-binding protein [Marinilabilia sp.]
MMSIVITGPEASGKTQLSRALSKHFNGFVVEEYARDYVEKLTTPYTFEDVEIIGRQQIADYNRARSKSEKETPVFFDTFLIVTKVWFEEVFNCCPWWIHRAIKTYKTNYALLCAPDLPWQADGVRENPHLRDYLFERYARELDYYGISYGIVKGEGEERLLSAIEIVEKHFNLVSADQ